MFFKLWTLSINKDNFISVMLTGNKLISIICTYQVHPKYITPIPLPLLILPPNA